MNPHDIIKNHIATEKAVRLMDSENKITLDVAFKASKPEIKAAAEELFKAKVTSVRTMITGYAKKKAVITLSKETVAQETLAKLGLM